FGVILLVQLVTAVIFVPLPAFIRDFRVALAFDHLRSLVVQLVQLLNTRTERASGDAGWVALLSWLFWIVVPSSWLGWWLIRRWALSTGGVTADTISIYRAPGWSLHRFAKWFFSRRTF